MGARLFHPLSRFAVLLLSAGVFFVVATAVLADTATSNLVTVYVRPAVTCLVSFTDSNGDRKANVGELVQWSASVQPVGPSYIYSWSGTDGLSGTASGVSKSYTVPGTKNATVTVYPTGFGPNDTINLSNSDDCGLTPTDGTGIPIENLPPNLVANAPTLSGQKIGSDFVAHQPVTLNGSIKNIGLGPTTKTNSSLFRNRFEWAFGSLPGKDADWTPFATDVGLVTPTILPADPTGYYSYSVQSLVWGQNGEISPGGPWYFRLCADQPPLPNGIEPESNENDNCTPSSLVAGPVTFKDQPSPLCDLRFNDLLLGIDGKLLIPFGGGGYFTWSTLNVPIGPLVCTASIVSGSGNWSGGKPNNTKGTTNGFSASFDGYSGTNYFSGPLSARSVFQISCPGLPGSTLSCTDTVTAIPLSVLCTADKSVVLVGEPVTWKATVQADPTFTPTLSWSGDENLSGTSNPLFKTYTTAGQKGATVTVTTEGLSRVASCPNITVQAFPDLTASAPSITSTGGSAGTRSDGTLLFYPGSFTITGTITNKSNATAAVSDATFTNKTQWSTDGTNWTDQFTTVPLDDTSSPLAVGGNRTIGNTSANKMTWDSTPTDPLVYYFRLCANRPVAFTESDSTDPSNCTVTSAVQKMDIITRPVASVDLTVTDDNGADQLKGAGGTLASQKYGGTHTLKWTSSNLQDNTCTLTRGASIVLASSAAANNTTGISTGGLSDTSYSYSVTCTKTTEAGGGTVTDTVTVAVASPLLSCSADPLAPLVNAVVTWTAMPTPVTPPTGSFSFTWSNLTPTYSLQGGTTLTSNPLKVSYSDAGVKNSTVTMTVPGAGQPSVAKTCPTTSSPPAVTGLPDLTASAPNITSTGGSAGTRSDGTLLFYPGTLKITGTITNKSNATAAVSDATFTNKTQWSTDGTNWTDQFTTVPLDDTSSPLAVGGNRTIGNTSANKMTWDSTPTDPLVYYFRLCANRPVSASFTESDSSDASNCTQTSAVQKMVVVAPFDYDLSANNTVLKRNATVRTTATRTIAPISGATRPVPLSLTKMTSPSGTVATGNGTSLTIGFSAGSTDPRLIVSITSNTSASPTASSEITVETKKDTPLGVYTVELTGSPNGGPIKKTNFTIEVEDNTTILCAASLNAVPDSVSSGGSATLKWDSVNAAVCTGNGFDTKNAVQNSVSTGALTANKTYTLSCKTAGAAPDTCQSAPVTVTVCSGAGCDSTKTPTPTGLCQDPNATNNGGALPCQYPPPLTQGGTPDVSCFPSQTTIPPQGGTVSWVCEPTGGTPPLLIQWIGDTEIVASCSQTSCTQTTTGNRVSIDVPYGANPPGTTKTCRARITDAKGKSSESPCKSVVTVTTAPPPLSQPPPTSPPPPSGGATPKPVFFEEF